MSIEIISARDRGNGYLHVGILLDGAPWAHGAVPAELAGDEAALADWLAAEADTMRCDRHRRAYPLAVVTPGEDEGELAAWERVLAAGVDDAVDDAGAPAGVPLDERRGGL